MNIKKYHIVNIHRGTTDERKRLIYAELRDECGRLVISATLDYICARIEEMTKD